MRLNSSSFKYSLDLVTRWNKQIVNKQIVVEVIVSE